MTKNGDVGLPETQVRTLANMIHVQHDINNDGRIDLRSERVSFAGDEMVALKDEFVSDIAEIRGRRFAAKVRNVFGLDPKNHIAKPVTVRKLIRQEISEGRPSVTESEMQEFQDRYRQRICGFAGCGPKPLP